MTQAMRAIGIALVNLGKPYDIAHVIQVALARGNTHLYIVGNTLPLDHPKVSSKVTSWNIPADYMSRLKYTKTKDLESIKEFGRLVATIVNGGVNALMFDWCDDDIIVIGGANGLSQRDIAQTDVSITIPTDDCVQFLTVPTVVPILCYLSAQPARKSELKV